MMEGFVFPKFTKKWHNTTYPAINPTNPSQSAKGKIIAITGGARGIGGSIASSFAAAGASDLILIGRSLQNLSNTKTDLEDQYPGTKVHTFSANVSDSNAVQAIFEEARKTVGPSNILVSNAGVLPKKAPVVSAPLDEWWEGYKTNVLGALSAVQAFLQNAAPEPTIVNITTGITHMDPILGLSSYSSSKEGFLRVMDFVRAENPAVRIFNVQPGVVGTDMHRNSGNDGIPEDDPSLPGDFVTWVVSPEADFLSGRYVWANWDVEELKAMKEKILAENLLVMGLRGWPAAE